jgi:hypothetical protein
LSAVCSGAKIRFENRVATTRQIKAYQSRHGARLDVVPLILARAPFASEVTSSLARGFLSEYVKILAVAA